MLTDKPQMFAINNPAWQIYHNVIYIGCEKINNQMV